MCKTPSGLAANTVDGVVNMSDFKNKTIIVTGSSRGLGAAIAIRMGAAGANVVIIGKTADAGGKLPGTIHETAAAVEQAGGKALPIQLDIRDEEGILAAVEKTVATFGGIDVLVNNASALCYTDTLNTPVKRFDLMYGVNVRATFAFSQACHQYLVKSDNPHIVTLSPPLQNLHAKWLAPALAYGITKFGMSMCTAGLADEFKDIAVNSLWPKTLIATAAIAKNFPPEVMQATRSADIVGDAMHVLLQKTASELTGQFLLDEDVLRDSGITDFAKYATHADIVPQDDIYVG
jgi:citronellol/citronellal dehydrogenase